MMKTKTKLGISKETSTREKQSKFGKKSSPGKTRKSPSLKPIKVEYGDDNIGVNAEEKLSANIKGLKTNNREFKIKSKEKKTNNKKTGVLIKKEDKIIKGIPSNLIGKDGKPKWNEIRIENKKLKEKRKVDRNGAGQYELSVKAKSLWEKLRLKKYNAEKKEALVSDLFMLLKGQIPNVVHSHDMARVVQWLLKLGSSSIRTAICEELCLNTVSYLQSRYARYCIKRALHYGSKADRNRIIQSCSGHILKLLSHTLAYSVVDLMYSMFASSEQRKQMHKEIYGEMHVLLPPEVTLIENVPDNIKPAILSSTKINLTKLLSKEQLLKSTLLQSVLHDFLDSCSEQDRCDILELIQGNILDLLITKEGSRVALLTVWYATNKMKKVIVKSVKGRVKEIAISEIGHLFLMALFDSIDDTVLVKKALIPELINEAEELAKNEFGRKVILYLVAHRDLAFFHPQQMEILSKGDSISTRKKDTALRKQEMLDAVSGSLLQKIAEKPVSWFGESSVAMVSLAIMKSGKGESLQAAFEKLVDYILDCNSIVEVNERHFHVIEQSAMHLVLKKLIQQDQSQPHRTKETFSMLLATRLTEENLRHILQFNRGCFLLVLLFESQNKKLCKILKSKISEPMKAFLQQQETTGSKILLTKLSETK